jgi:hypothetical protein
MASYLVFLVAIRGLSDVACLHDIPASMPWRAFKLPTCDLVLLEWLQRPNRNNPPPSNLRIPKEPEFSRRPAGISLPVDFGEAAPTLDALYETLTAEKRAGSLSKVAVQSAILLSKISGCPVLSIASDDDDWDLACESEDGALVSLRFAAGDQDVHVSSDGHVQMDASPDGQRRIHRIAEQVATTWCEDLRPLFGFDGDTTRIPLSEVARVNFVPEPPVPRGVPRPVNQSKEPPARKRPPWKFW